MKNTYDASTDLHWLLSGLLICIFFTGWFKKILNPGYHHDIRAIIVLDEGQQLQPTFYPHGRFILKRPCQAVVELSELHL